MRRWFRQVSTRAGRRAQDYLLSAPHARRKPSAAWVSYAVCASLALACGEPASKPRAAVPAPSALEPVAELPVVLFVGTSLTAGYGLASEEAFPARVQQRIDEAALPYRVVNAGVSGDTSAGGRRRIDWLLRMPVAVLVVELPMAASHSARPP